jgi:hypothetical protein
MVKRDQLDQFKESIREDNNNDQAAEDVVCYVEASVGISEDEFVEKLWYLYTDDSDLSKIQETGQYERYIWNNGIQQLINDNEDKVPEKLDIDIYNKENRERRLLIEAAYQQQYVQYS